MRARGILIAVLSVVACARQITAVGHSGYAPKWHVGDWWVVKTWEETGSAIPPFWAWHYYRYDIARIEKIGGLDCFAVETRRSGPAGEISDFPANVFYVHKGDWFLARGPNVGRELRLPLFPLRSENPDTTIRWLDYPSLWLRETCEAADSAEVRRILAEGDTAGGRVAQPTGAVYQVRVERGEEPEPGPPVPHGWGRRIDGSLQLWGGGQPWRVYNEEYIEFERPKPTRRLVERSWLIAVGHSGK